MNGPNPVSASDALHHGEPYAFVFHYVPLIDTTLPPSARARIVCRCPDQALSADRFSDPSSALNPISSQPLSGMAI